MKRLTLSESKTVNMHNDASFVKTMTANFMQIKTLLFFVTIIPALFLLSCDRDEELLGNILTDEQESVVTNDAATDNLSEAADYEIDYFTGSDQAIAGAEDVTKGTTIFRPRYVDGVGPIVTINPVGYSFPKTITIDYGDGVELINGRTLKGVISIVASAPIFTNGATRTVNYQNFFVDSTQIAGEAVRTFSGTDSTERVFTNVSDLVITFADETVLLRHGQHTRNLAEGFETIFDHSDDLILITGSVNYTAEDQTTFGKTIIEPLTKRGGCRYIVQGVVEFNYNGEQFAMLDYGNGSCDDVATIIKDGETVQITLEHRRRFPWLR